MVRYYTVVLCLIVVFAAAGLAQVTITKTDVENGFVNSLRTNYSNQYDFMSYPTVSLYNASGVTQDFDFSAAPQGDQKDTTVHTYAPAAGLPGASNFPGATLGATSEFSPFPGATITTVQYISIENDGIYGIGSYMHQLFPPFVDTVIITKVSPKELYAPLPMTYGTVRSWKDTLINDATTGEYEVTMRTFTVDGFGSLTPPPGGGMPSLSKTAVGEQCIRLLIDYVIDVFDGSDNLIAHAHYREVNFVGKAMTVLTFDVEDSNYVSGSTPVRGMNLEVKTGTTAVEPMTGGIPESFSLSQNYPNPFNPSTKISFALPAEGFVTLKVFDILGREVASLVNDNMNAGTHTADFNAANLSGGIYLARLSAGNYSASMKMSLVK